jgi:superfamily I DNA/RNA helicase
VARERDVVVLTPSEAKGLEFDRVVLVAPEEMSPADQYIALTRCTSRLAIVSEARRLPWEGSVAQPSARPTDDGAAKRP